MFYTNEYIKENFEELNNLTEEEALKYIELNPKFILHIKHPTVELIEHSLQFDDFYCTLLYNIKNYPKEFINKVLNRNKDLIKYMNNIPNGTKIELGVLEYFDENKIENIPEKKVTPSIFQQWLSVHPVLKFTELPEELQTKENLLHCINKIEYEKSGDIPENLYDEEAVKLLLDRNMEFIRIVPLQYVNLAEFTNYLINYNPSEYIYADDDDFIINIPSDKADKLLLNENIPVEGWVTLHNASPEIFAKILEEENSPELIDYVPSNILEILFNNDDLKWLLNHENEMALSDIPNAKDYRGIKATLLDNTTEEYQHLLYENDITENLSYFKNLYPSVVKRAIIDDELDILSNLAENLRNDSDVSYEELIDFAIEVNKNSIFAIDNPTKEQILKAVKIHPIISRSIANLSRFKNIVTRDEIFHAMADK